MKLRFRIQNIQCGDVNRMNPATKLNESIPSASVQMQPVATADENVAASASSPAGSIQFNHLKLDVANQLKVGQEYFVELTEVQSQ